MKVSKSVYSLCCSTSWLRFSCGAVHVNDVRSRGQGGFVQCGHFATVCVEGVFRCWASANKGRGRGSILCGRLLWMTPYLNRP